MLLRLVSLPQSRAKYSLFLHLPFFLALLALLFLSFFSFVSKAFWVTIEVFHTRAAKRHRVCVCHPLYQRVQCHCFHCNHSTRQGGKASSDEPCPTKLNRWRGRSIRVPAIGTFDQAVTSLSTFWFMVFHDTPHKPTAALRRFAADFECQIVFECSCQHCSTLRFLRTHAPFRSLTFLPNVGTECN